MAWHSSSCFPDRPRLSRVGRPETVQEGLQAETAAPLNQQHRRRCLCSISSRPAGNEPLSPPPAHCTRPHRTTGGHGTILGLEAPQSRSRHLRTVRGLDLTTRLRTMAGANSVLLSQIASLQRRPAERCVPPSGLAGTTGHVRPRVDPLPTLWSSALQVYPSGSLHLLNPTPPRLDQPHKPQPLSSPVSLSAPLQSPPQAMSGHSEARYSPHPSTLFRSSLRSFERVPARSVSDAAGGGFDGTERAGTRSDGRKQGRNSADRCGEDRALQDPVVTLCSWQ